MAAAMTDKKSLAADLALVESVRRKLSAAAREERKLKTRDDRAAFMRAFWAGITPRERAAFAAHILWPGRDQWEAGLTPEGRLEQHAKQARSASARNRRAWADRSLDERQAVRTAISAGHARFWAAHPEARVVRSAAVKAGIARRAKQGNGP
jgi:hypothetical protein